jgi:GDPmannose 4,6-dehydratase
MPSRSPYACAKAYGFYLTQNYREAYKMFCCNGILFNHESPRRGENFVTRKITRGVGRIVAGLDKRLSLGNLEAKRDWGFAGDYVVAMWLMLQHDTPADYVVATGETHSVKEFLELAFGRVDLDWHDFVDLDPRQIRPAEVDLLQGDASKAKRELGWQPKVSFKDLVAMMVDIDLEIAKREAHAR